MMINTKSLLILSMNLEIWILTQHTNNAKYIMKIDYSQNKRCFQRLRLQVFIKRKILMKHQNIEAQHQRFKIVWQTIVLILQESQVIVLWILSSFKILFVNEMLIYQDHLKVVRVILRVYLTH